mgnify:CR=1 FL=1
MNIIVLGAGTFGTSIANELAVNTANKVLIYSSNQQKVDEINSEHTNKSCFPNKSLIKNLKATSERDHILLADVIFIALPSKVILGYLSVLQSSFKKDVLFVNLSKGLLKGGVTILESLRKELGLNNVVTLKGPSFAIEIMNRAETVLTLGFSQEKQKEIIFEIFSNTCIHLESTKDINGVEILGVIKNIYAILLGIVDEKFISLNSQFMILSKVFNEIKVLNNILIAENKRLRELIDESINSEEIFARVIIDRESPYLKSIVLNRGSKDNVKIGMAIMDRNYLVGQIIEVNYSNSRALLLSDLNSKIPVIIQPPFLQAVASGTGKNYGIIEYTKDEYKENQIEKEAVVYTSGLGGIFKPGIPVGKLTNNPEKLNFFSDFGQLSFVKIVEFKIGEDQ